MILIISLATAQTASAVFTCGAPAAEDGKKFCEGKDENKIENCKSMEVDWWEELNKDNVKYDEIFEKFNNKMNKQFKDQIALMLGKETEKASLGDGITDIYSYEKSEKCDADFKSSEVFNYKGGEKEEFFAKKIMEDKAKYQCAILMYLKLDKINTDINVGENSNIFKGNIEQEKRLILEVETTGKAVIVALEALSEMQIAYLIHKKLLCVIEALNEVRLKLKDYVGEIVKINGKFINCGFQN